MQHYNAESTTATVDEQAPPPSLVVRANAAGLWVEDAEGRLVLNLPGASAAERERVRQIVEGR